MSLIRTSESTDRRRLNGRLLAIGAAASLLFAALAVFATSGGVNPPNSPDVSKPPVTPTAEPTAPPDPLTGIDLDPLQAARIAELRDYLAWLDEAGAQGYVGELGWSRQDPAWNQLARYWYLVADDAGLWTSLWAAGSAWGDYPLTVYGASPRVGGLNTTYLPAEVLETPGWVSRHGVNLAGLEFGTQQDGFSAAQPGILGQDYFDEPAASFTFLAERGIDLVRLPFRWERLQPTVGGPLDEAYAGTIDSMLDAAAENGIDVVLNLHNFGAYQSATGTLLLGTDALPAAALTEIWQRIADRWGAHPAVIAYGLMNEPHSLPGTSQRDAAQRWEAITQQTVLNLRAAGDSTLVMVAGYDFSSLARWREIHPSPWIVDPANNFRYEAHHYWDDTGEGFYALPYADERVLIGR